MKSVTWTWKHVGAFRHKRSFENIHVLRRQRVYFGCRILQAIQDLLSNHFPCYLNSKHITFYKQFHLVFIGVYDLCIWQGVYYTKIWSILYPKYWFWLRNSFVGHCFFFNILPLMQDWVFHICLLLRSDKFCLQFHNICAY